MAVEEEAKVVLEARQHEVLVARIAGKNDVVGVDVVFGSHGNAARISNSDGQPHDDERAGHAKRALAGELVGNKYVLQSATPALIKPKSMAERTRPSRG